jgi:hypothetical protein
VAENRVTIVTATEDAHDSVACDSRCPRSGFEFLLLYVWSLRQRASLAAICARIIRCGPRSQRARSPCCARNKPRATRYRGSFPNGNLPAFQTKSSRDRVDRQERPGPQRHSASLQSELAQSDRQGGAEKITLTYRGNPQDEGRRSFMRNAPIIGIAVALLLLSTAGRSQNLPVAEFDFKAAESRLESNEDFGGNKVPNPARRSLHEAEQAPDGSRGYGLGAPIIRRVAVPDPPPPPFKTEREWETYYQYCAWDAIVKATLIDSTPVLSSDKTLIYTVSHFEVVDTIKSDVPFTAGQQLVVYRAGGELEDGGEILRIDTLDSAAFEPQKSCILRLRRRDKDASVQQYSLAWDQTIAVNIDKVYPISGKIAWLSGMDAFPTGSTYAAIRTTFAKVHTQKSCDAR